jgi:hypothetical protein
MNLENKMHIDVVIVNYNSTSYLLDCISSMHRATPEGVKIRICVFDNASEDGVCRIKGQFPEVDLLCSRKNIGFARGVNYAMARGGAPYVLVLNPDTSVDSFFIKEIIEFMEKNQDIGIVGPKILDSSSRIQGSARRFPNAKTALFGRSTFLSRLFPNNSQTRINIPAYSCKDCKPIDVDWVSGACMIVRRKAVEQVGMLDERFFMYWEDADWCRRMREHGWRVVFFPGCQIVHYTGVSSRKNFMQSILEFHKSAYYLFCKSAGQPPSRVLKGMVFSALIMRAYILIMMKMILGLKRIR